MGIFRTGGGEERGVPNLVDANRQAARPFSKSSAKIQNIFDICKFLVVQMEEKCIFIEIQY